MKKSNNIAIITARSGSKGLPDKNIKELCGIPLLAYSIIAAQKSGMFSTIMVSTDSEKYANISKKYGAEVPFLRSDINSNDNASSWDTVIEVLNKYAEQGLFFETVCLLQPTSPLRIADDIINGYQIFFEKAADSVTSVCETDHSPLWCMTLDETLSLDLYNSNKPNVPRQELPTYYRVNGALYIRKVVYTGIKSSLLNKKDYAYIMPTERSVDIDSKLDFVIAENIFKNASS